MLLRRCTAPIRFSSRQYATRVQPTVAAAGPAQQRAPAAAGETQARTASTVGLGGSGRGVIGVGRASASGANSGGNPIRLNPRQLAGHLDEFVVGQDRAKKVLAVAVYNHYARLHQMMEHSQESAPEGSAASSSLDGVDPFSSSFSIVDTRSPILAPHPPHVARIQPRDRSKDGRQREREAEAASSIATAPPSPPPLAADQSPSDLFNPSYSPSGHSPKSRRSSRDVMGTASQARDPTLYNSPLQDGMAASPRRGSSAHSTTLRSSFTRHQRDDSDLLTDFTGQTIGKEAFDTLILNATLNDELGVKLPPPPPPPDPYAPIYEKSNVLLLGPTGSGKTLLARTLAKCLDVPFVSVEATGLTMSGYVGEDVETCIHRLLVAADYDPILAGRGIVSLDEIDKLSRSASASYSKDVSGEGVQQALLKILEGTIVQVPAGEGAGGRDGKGVQKGKEGKGMYLVDTSNILFICSGAFVGLEKIVQHRLQKTSIGFTARVSSDSSIEAGSSRDKAAATAAKAQRDSALLDQVEPTDLVKFGFIPEFIGRLPVIASLATLSEADLLRVLTEPRNALVKQMEDLFDVSGVTLRFTTLALREVARRAFQKGTGARGLRGELEKVLLDAMFDAPQSSICSVLVTKEVVEGNKPAHYYSRGQKHVFENDLASEEEQEQANRAAMEDSATEVQAEDEPETRRRATA